MYADIHPSLLVSSKILRKSLDCELSAKTMATMAESTYRFLEGHSGFECQLTANKSPVVPLCSEHSGSINSLCSCFYALISGGFYFTENDICSNIYIGFH